MAEQSPACVHDTHRTKWQSGVQRVCMIVTGLNGRVESSVCVLFLIAIRLTFQIIAVIRALLHRGGHEWNRTTGYLSLIQRFS